MRSVTVTDARVTVVLSRGGVAVTDDRVALLAVQEVVWTAQAVVGKGNLPVRIETADGSRILGRDPSGLQATRPAKADQWQVLGPIWVTAPASQAVVAAGPVTVSGEATVVEAALRWRVEQAQGGAVVREGPATASEGAPGRGTWRLTTTLSPGIYRVVVWSEDMEGGGVAASRSVEITVR